MSDEVTELHNDLLRRAEACEELADSCARNAVDGHPCSTEIAIARRRGKADAYRHAAELLRSSPISAEVERLRTERDAALAEVALWRGDETAALLGAAAAGVLPRCDSCEGGALATLYARTPAGELWSCDAHRGRDQWEDLPHAARLRAAGAL